MILSAPIYLLFIYCAYCFFIFWTYGLVLPKLVSMNPGFTAIALMFIGFKIVEIILCSPMVKSTLNNFETAYCYRKLYFLSMHDKSHIPLAKYSSAFSYSMLFVSFILYKVSELRLITLDCVDLLNKGNNKQVRKKCPKWFAKIVYYTLLNIVLDVSLPNRAALFIKTSIWGTFKFYFKYWFIYQAKLLMLDVTLRSRLNPIIYPFAFTLL